MAAALPGGAPMLLAPLEDVMVTRSVNSKNVAEEDGSSVIPKKKKHHWLDLPILSWPFYVKSREKIELQRVSSL